MSVQANSNQKCCSVVQYRSNVSYHRLATNETRLARNETRLARNETRLARNETHLAGNEKFLASALQVPLSVVEHKALIYSYLGRVFIYEATLRTRNLR